MRQVYCLFFFFLGSFLYAQDERNEPSLLPVNEIFYALPPDLKDLILWVPAYDAPEPREDWTEAQRQTQVRMEKYADESNAYLRELMGKYYEGPYELIALDKVKQQREQGARYFLDVVIMPKQFDAPNPKAMISAFRKHSSTNFLYTHHNVQFHYYFYLRDLQTDDAYLGAKFIGNAEVYPAMIQFLKRVKKEMKD